MSKVTNFKKHRPMDRSDPGFVIPGRVLRWVSGKVSENNPGRVWAVLRKPDLPKELVDHLERINPDLFSGTDTIRRGDLVLAYASKEAADEAKFEIAEKARDQESRVRRGPQVPDGRGGNRASVEVNESEDVTEQMIARFKKTGEE